MYTLCNVFVINLCNNIHVRIFLLLICVILCSVVSAMVSYNVVVGDTVTKVFIRLFDLKPWSLLARRDVVVLLATVFVTVPLCITKDMARLARASAVSLFFVVFILIAIIIRLFTFSHFV